MRILVYKLASEKLAGIELFLLNMNEFMNSDVKFDYIVFGDGSCIHQERVEARGGRIIRIPPYRHNPFKYFKEVNKVLKNGKDEYEAVYMNLFSMVHVIPALFAKRFGYRVILHAHNNDVAQQSKLYRFAHRFLRWLTSRMNFLRLTNSDISTEFMFGRNHLKDTTMIYNAIDSTRFAFEPRTRCSMRQKFGFEDRNVYGFSGRIAYQKNPLFLIDIFAEIAKLDDKATFVVCGDGDLMEKVQAKAKDLKLDIRFTGAVKNVQDYYQAMDCFILPSRFEGLGIVLIEAQCAGLPCLTSADVVPKDAQVSEALLRYISLSELPEVWAQNAVELLKTDFDRSKGSEYVRKAGFDITKEALRLEKILSEV